MEGNSKCEVCGKDGTWANPAWRDSDKCPVQIFKKQVHAHFGTVFGMTVEEALRDKQLREQTKSPTPEAK